MLIVLASSTCMSNIYALLVSLFNEYVTGFVLFKSY